MKTKTTLLTLALTAIMWLNVQAQKIAVIDINAVLQELPEYITAQGQLDAIAAEWNQEIANEYDQIKSLYNKYQAEQVLLSDEVKEQRQEEIMQKEKIVRELQKRKFGSDYDLILDKAGSAGVLFVGNEFDKTDLIKRRLGIR